MLIKPVKCLLIVLVSCISFPALAQGDSAISKPKVLVSDSAISYDPTHDRFYKNGHEYVRNEFQYHNKGYMFETHILLEWIKPGVRILNGYKFNQFAALAIGVGIELPVNYNLEARGAGGYIPLYMHFTGDVLKKKITPFYTVEAGYARLLTPRLFNVDSYEDDYYHSEGGLMGGLGFGVRGYSRRNLFHWAVSMNADFIHFHSNEYGYTVGGLAYGSPSQYFNYSVSSFIWSFGLRYSMGLFK